MLDISIIVPLLNESAVAPELIQQLGLLKADEIIIVDGGSVDGTRQLMSNAGFFIIDSPAGRAKQMNTGATFAKNSMLLFLHADTVLPSAFRQELDRADVWGRFDVCFSDSSFSMKVIAFFMNWRSRLSSIATGDQAIFVQKEVFDSVGGFPELPLMEDVALCKRLRQLHQPYNSREKVITSSRRWQENGVLNTVVKMWWCRFAFFLGISPSRLKKGYDDVR